MPHTWVPRDGVTRRLLTIALAALLLFATLAFTPGVTNEAHGQVDDGDPGSCDADILMILDSSGSMTWNGNQGLNAVDDAMDAFVAELAKPVALGGAPDSGIAAVHFSNTAVVGFGTYQNVVTQGAALNAYVSPGGAYYEYPHNWTNWEDAFIDALTIATPDYVFFLTDGQPTIFNGDTNPSSTPAKYEEATQKAEPFADQLRANVAGSDTVVGIGIGEGFTNVAGALGRLQRVTDEAVAIPFDQLASELAARINEICAPQVDITKTVTPDTLPEPGGDATFEVVVENTSDITEADVMLTLLDDDIYGSLDGFATCQLNGAGPAVDPFATWIPYGDTLVCTWDASFTDKAPGWSETDTVETQGLDPLGRQTNLDDDSATITIVDVPSSIEVTKTAQAPTSLPEPGGEFTFQVEIENTSAVDTVTIDTITDDPWGTLTGANPALSGSTCSVPQELDPGESYFCSFTVEILGEPGVYENTVTASGVDDDGNDVSDDGSDSVTITNVDPVISVVKTANPTSILEPGGNVTFTVTITNDSDEDVEITSIEDDVFGTLAGDADCEVGTDLAPDESCSFNFIEAVNGNAGFVHQNTVTVEAVDNDGSTAQDEDDATVTITDAAPSITVEKTANPDTVPEPGANVTFTVTVTNTSGEAVEITSIEDSVFGTLAGDADCQVGTQLDPAESCSFSFIEAVNGNAGFVHNNIVTVVAEDDDGTEASDMDDATVVVTDVAPSIDVDKVANPTSVAEPGGDVTFTVTITNDGDETVEITSIEDDIYGTLTGDADCQVGTVLAPNASCSFSFTEPVEGNAGDVHENTVTVVAEDDDGTTTDDDDSAVVTITDVEPTISVDKIANPTAVAEPGGVVTFTVTVTNDGTAEDLTLTSLVDDQFGDLNGQGTCSVPQTLTAGGGTYVCSFEGLVEGEGGDVHINEVTATATDDDDNEVDASDTAEVEILEAGIDIEKTGALGLGDDGIANPGDVITYTFVITNTGDAALFDVEVEDLLPGLSDISCEAIEVDGGSLLSTLASAVLGVLGPGDSVECTATYEITQEDIDAGQVDNCAEASGATLQAIELQTGERVSDEDCAETPIPQDPSIDVTKTADPPSIVGDGTVTFTIVVENDGNVTLSNLTLEDVLTWGDSGSQPLPQCETLDTTTLAPGASTSVECTVDLDYNVHGDSATNTVTATADPPNDGDPVEDTDTVTVPITLPDAGTITIDKLVENQDGEFVDVAGWPNSTTEASWQITVTNPNEFTLSGLVLTDPVAPACEAAFAQAIADAGYAVGDDLTLPGGASVTFECDSTIPAEEAVENVATVSGTDEWDRPVGPVSDNARINRVAGTAQIGDTVWLDENKNGIQDNGEKGIAGATVRLTLPDDAVSQNATVDQVTNQNGLYTFGGLDAGTYTVEVVLSSIPDQGTGSLSLTTAGSYTVTLAENESYLDADFGVVGSLPVTGLSSDRIALLGLALLLAGGLAILVTRQRREDDGPDRTAA